MPKADLARVCSRPLRDASRSGTRAVLQPGSRGSVTFVPPPTRRTLTSYGGQRREHVLVYEPENEAQLAELLVSAHERGVALAPVGASLSFAGQGLPRRVALSTARLNGCRVDAGARRLIAGAGVTTGEALEATLARGLAPAVLPSTRHVTLGGSISSDTYSRMTPGLGRESRQVRRVRLVTPRGEVLDCTRDRNTELFHAAVGGFGLVGVITEVEHALDDVGRRPALLSSAHAFEGVDGLEMLLPDRRPAGLPPGPWPGAGCVVMQRGARRRTLITRHRVEDTSARRRTVAHQSGLARVGVELLAQELPAFAAWAWQTNWVPGRVVGFSDDLAPATFFMDGNVRARSWATRLRRSVSVLQQSFVLPIAARTSAEVDRVEAFVREALDRMRDAGQSAGMFDVGFLPRSEPFLLSPNHDRDAFLVSIAFVVRGAARVRAAERLLAKLTRVCGATYGGQVHLTKQAHCTDEELRAMYRGPIEGLRALRAEHDPRGVLDTALGRRFGLRAAAE